MIDTFERSFCSIYSRTSSLSDLPFEISLITNGNCTLNLDVIQLLDREPEIDLHIRTRINSSESLADHSVVCSYS